MSLMVLNGGVVAGGLWQFSAPPSPGAQQERTAYTYGHSLWLNNQNYQSVPRWVDLFVAAAADSKTFENEFTFATVPAAVPPSSTVQNMPGVTKPTPTGPYGTWAAADSAGFTDVISFVDNFEVGPIRSDMQQNPRIAVPAGSSVNMVQHYVNAFSGWESGSSLTDLNYWIYETWGDAGSMPNPKPLNEADGTEAYAGGFADYRAYTTTTFGRNTFFDTCLANVQTDLPALADRIKLIPACRVLISVMELAALSGMTAGDWFVDDAPHGSDSTYCIVGAIVYSCFYGEAAPQPNFAGTAVNASIQSNWAAIASHINTQVNS